MLRRARIVTLFVILGIALTNARLSGALESDAFQHLDSISLVCVLGPFILLGCALGMGVGWTSCVSTFAATILVGLVALPIYKDLSSFGDVAGGLYLIAVLIELALGFCAFLVACFERHISRKRVA